MDKVDKPTLNIIHDIHMTAFFYRLTEFDILFVSLFGNVIANKHSGYAGLSS
jgi:hypothetical protein